MSLSNECQIISEFYCLNFPSANFMLLLVFLIHVLAYAVRFFTQFPIECDSKMGEDENLTFVDEQKKIFRIINERSLWLSATQFIFPCSSSPPSFFFLYKFFSGIINFLLSHLLPTPPTRHHNFNPLIQRPRFFSFLFFFLLKLSVNTEEKWFLVDNHRFLLQHVMNNKFLILGKNLFFENHFMEMNKKKIELWTVVNHCGI